MVDFGNSVFEGKLDASTPLLNPVEDRSAETFAGGLSDSIDRFNKMVFDPTKKAAQADADKNGLFADYAEKVGLIADAKDQGKFGTDEAMRNIRVAQNQFLSNHPELTDDFFTFSNKLMTENGFGGSIVRESPAEAGNRKKLEGYAQDGWDITNPESLAAAEKFSQDKIYLQGVANEIDKIEASGKVASASIKAQAIGGLHSVVANGIPWVNDQINKAYTQLQGVTDPVQRQAIIDQTKANVAQQTAIIQSLRSQTGDEASGYLLTGIEGLMTNFDAVASGKSKLEAVQNSNTMIDASYQHLIMTSDPELAALIVMDKTSPFKNPEAYNRLDQKRIELAAKLGIKNTTDENGQVTSESKPPDIIDKVENVAAVFDDLKQTTGNIVRAGGEASPKVVGEQANKIVNVLRSTAKYGANDGDARNFTATVDFLSDPTVGKFMEQNSSLIGPQIADSARQVVEQQYGEVVLNLINERWTTATGQIKTSGATGFSESIGMTGNMTVSSETIEDVSKIVEPYWNGVGIEMKPAAGFETNPQVREIVKGLNRGSDSITGPLNKLIRMSAHLSGSTDYEKVYNETYKPRLWQTGTEKSKPTMDQMTGKDLSGPTSLNELSNIPKGALEAPKRPADFKEAPSSLRGQTGQLLDAIGAAEGATYDTLFGYAERSGGDFSGTDITTMTVSDVQSLQKEMVKKNGISSAVGKYQFIQATLKEAIKGLGLKGDEKFTPELQDKLALWLLKNRTSYDDWATGTGDAAKFQNELASQWASIPNTSGKSAYAGDEVNNASAEGKRLIGML